MSQLSHRFGRRHFRVNAPSRRNASPNPLPSLKPPDYAPDVVAANLARACGALLEFIE